MSCIIIIVPVDFYEQKITARKDELHLSSNLPFNYLPFPAYYITSPEFNNDFDSSPRLHVHNGALALSSVIKTVEIISSGTSHLAG